MNDGHRELCTSEQWRAILEADILPGALARAELGPRVVEVGPGPGFTTDVLRRRTQRVTAVEIDPVLAGELRHRLEGQNVEVIMGDGRSTGLDGASYTGAASFHMLHHVPTPEAQDAVFRELARLLVPGGVLVLADGFDSEGVRAFHEADDYNPIDPAGLSERLGAAGFVDVSLATHDLGWYCWAAKPAASLA